MQNAINKKKLSETDIITKFIMTAIKNAGWNLMKQIRQEVKLCVLDSVESSTH